MRKKTLWLLGISLLFLILVTVLGIVWRMLHSRSILREKICLRNRRAVWNRLDGAGYVPAHALRAVIKHPYRRAYCGGERGDSALSGDGSRSFRLKSGCGSFLGN